MIIIDRSALKITSETKCLLNYIVVICNILCDSLLKLCKYKTLTPVALTHKTSTPVALTHKTLTQTLMNSNL